MVKKWTKKYEEGYSLGRFMIKVTWVMLILTSNGVQSVPIDYNKCVEYSTLYSSCCEKCQSNWFALRCECVSKNRMRYYLNIPTSMYLGLGFLMNVLMATLYVYYRVRKLRVISRKWRMTRVGKEIIFDEDFVLSYKDDYLQNNFYHLKNEDDELMMSVDLNLDSRGSENLE